MSPPSCHLSPLQTPFAFTAGLDRTVKAQDRVTDQQSVPQRSTTPSHSTPYKVRTLRPKRTDSPQQIPHSGLHPLLCMDGKGLSGVEKSDGARKRWGQPSLSPALLPWSAGSGQPMRSPLCDPCNFHVFRGTTFTWGAETGMWKMPAVWGEKEGVQRFPEIHQSYPHVPHPSPSEASHRKAAQPGGLDFPKVGEQFCSKKEGKV